MRAYLIYHITPYHIYEKKLHIYVEFGKDVAKLSINALLFKLIKKDTL